ncbi:SAM-dependent methyltransferase [Leptolyngbya sp. 'hensonii']|uniref:class I SAM-dependent methyltransferase n=1 Tax=Leptolyngbya sp. 'hensonii' TaxID=1922337 RepID=UPI00094F882E|nr:class I SAM-dependent methyltransferase [Leptolyngbya sp. 'hensonii']OLP16905.1 SAM-dependent methyltransferase [Leptolyngbya sp. 'hensonii']
MATILREWSYRYQWLYDSISRLAALSVGGEGRFRQLALEEIPLQPEAQVLDLCCGSGQATQMLVQRAHHVTGLDASPLSLKRARANVPEAAYVEAWAEEMPFEADRFDLVHTSAALHEMESNQLRQILQEVYRVLKPGGWFVLVDFHPPTNALFWPGVALFLWLFETETAWALLQTDLAGLLTEIGFQVDRSKLYAGGSLQVLQARK